jgi:hypothetical protein
MPEALLSLLLPLLLLLVLLLLLPSRHRQLVLFRILVLNTSCQWRCDV